ncbi:MAG: DUF4347 domain-containing protein [Cyanobacteria bacterium P01_E01_bin.42]
MRPASLFLLILRSRIGQAGVIVLTLLLAPISFARAQSIVAAPDGTGTAIAIDGNTYNIGGGTQAGANLFHSFQELGLNPDEVANFLANPSIINILGRVTGGNPSIIEGLIQVTGGNPNLFLMNPAGWIFTNGASIDVPGSFGVTTATRIGFEEGYFNAIGANEYSVLTGSPSSLIFDSQNPSTILNEADLSVPNGSLWMVGGSVINTGSIETPNGTLTLAAIPGEKQIKLTHDGMELGLVLDAVPITEGESSVSTSLNPREIGLKVTDIPRYLTGGNITSATEIAYDAEGNLRLVGSNVTLQDGDVVIAEGAIAAPEIVLMGSGVKVADPSQVQGDTTVVVFPENEENELALAAIDATVDDYQDFLFGGKAGTIAFTVDSDESGISAIGDRLSAIAEQGGEVGEVHIVSEGNAGNFWLGKDFVSHANIGEYRQQLQAWGVNLTPEADILLYSCLTGFGAVGDSLIESLAEATGADVAASTNLTGSAALGGDWVLEKRTGNIESSLAFQQDVLNNYDDTLAIITVTSNLDNTTASDGLVTLREAINAANNNANTADTVSTTTGIFGNDEIRFSGDMTINLGGMALSIDDNAGNLIIDGQTNQIVVDGSATSTVFTISNAGGSANVTFKNLTIQNGNIGGSGGGILNPSNGATLTVENSTVTGNTAGTGGGIYSQNGDVTLINSTISGNVATGNGGGIHAPGGTITNSTITNNTAASAGGFGDGGGIYSPASLTVQNSIIAGNADNNATNQNPDVAGTFVDNGNNLIGISDGSSNFTNSTLVGTLANPLDPVLSPLGNYSGQTQTHALLPRSPAINAGADIASITTDQRGQARVNGSFDIGAVEVSADLAVSQTVSNANPSPGDSVTFTIAIANNGIDAVGNVSLNALLPTGLTLTSATPSTGSYDSSTGNWAIADLDGDFNLVTADNTTSLILTATVDANASGTLTNTAQNLTGTGEDSDLTNNSASSTISIDTVDTVSSSILSTGTTDETNSIDFSSIVESWERREYFFACSTIGELNLQVLNPLPPNPLSNREENSEVLLIRACTELLEGEI